MSPPTISGAATDQENREETCRASITITETASSPDCCSGASAQVRVRNRVRAAIRDETLPTRITCDQRFEEAASLATLAGLVTDVMLAS